MSQKLAKFIFYKVLGWKMVGAFPGHINKMVIAVAPHTSYFDFFLGVLVRAVLNEPINWIGKKSLFDSPIGWFFRWMGGAPIDRSKKSDTVAATVKIFKSRSIFRLALSPEGTRKKVDRWKTGFYFIAKAAEVPIVLVAFDFGKKKVKFSSPLIPTDHKEADLAEYQQFFDGVEGYHH
ncbi:MAG: acyltransferase [Pseudozobellia sp.]|nr:acyltransferase [Pseudozobellia sp.]MBG48993.1 acyltransferase [Pseudozobellia sp.]|tara:strand:- start:32704 stop:33237 length:534 start_codon:yes stop_codon:yes gene_type:complete